MYVSSCFMVVSIRPQVVKFFSGRFFRSSSTLSVDADVMRLAPALIDELGKGDRHGGAGMSLHLDGGTELLT